MPEPEPCPFKLHQKVLVNCEGRWVPATISERYTNKVSYVYRVQFDEPVWTGGLCTTTLSCFHYEIKEVLNY